MELVFVSIVVLMLRCSTAADPTYSSLPSGQIKITLEFGQNGRLTNETLCTSQTVGSPCLPKVSWDDNSFILIDYSLDPSTLTTYPPNSTPKTLKIRQCYSKESQQDRPWRKHKDIIKKDKACQRVVEKNLPATDGMYNWTIPSNVASATNYIQILVECANLDGGDGVFYCAFDDTKKLGFYETKVMDSIPTWLIIVVAVCVAFAPMVLATYFTWDFVCKPKKN